MRLHFWIAAAHACHGLQPPIIHPATQQLRGLRVESTPAARTGSPRACTRLGKEWLTRPGPGCSRLGLFGIAMPLFLAVTSKVDVRAYSDRS